MHGKSVCMFIIIIVVIIIIIIIIIIINMLFITIFDIRTG